MRFFPGAVRRSVATAVSGVVAAALLAVVTSTPAAGGPASEELKDRKHQVHEQVKDAERAMEVSSRRAAHANRRLERARGHLRDARRELRQLRGELRGARAADTRLRRQLAEAEERLERARGDLQAGQAAVTQQHARLTDTIVDNYQNGPAAISDLTSYLSARTPGDMTRLDQAHRTIEEGEDWALDSLRATEVMLGVRKQQVERATEQVARRREAAADTLVRVQRLAEAATAARTTVTKRVRFQRVVTYRAARARQADRAALARLRAREHKIRKQILKAMRAEKQAKNGYRGATRGLLLAPVAGGRVSSPFGYRRHPIYGYWGLHNGVDYAAPCGAPLRAVGGGTVFSRYYSSVYGRRLYLNVGRVNGANITVVYNHLSRYGARVGQRVREGQVVGRVGTSGWSTGCHLHFTVLRNGRPVNPAPYL